VIKERKKGERVNDVIIKRRVKKMKVKLKKKNDDGDRNEKISVHKRKDED
jgi:hypothetical protein